MRNALLDVAIARRDLLAKRSARHARLLDALGQQAAWWAVVLLVRHGHPTLALLPTALLTAWSIATRGHHTWLLAALGAVLGAVSDTLLVRLGHVSFPGDPGTDWTATWMVGLWAAFGAAFNASMAFVAARSAPVAAGVGALFGVIGYHAGQSLGVLALGRTPVALFAVAGCWALSVSVLRMATLHLSSGQTGARA